MTVNAFFSVLYIFVFILIFSNAINEHCNKNSLNKPNSFKIKELIFCDYDKSIRPVLKEEPLLISSQLLVHNFDFFERKNRIVIKGWGIMKWRDEHMYWELEDYNDVHAIIISAKDVWTPDLVIINGNKFSTKFMKRDAACVAFYNKIIICPFPINISGSCKADFTYWPFDTHNCTISIESFYHHGDEIDFNDTETGMDITTKYQKTWDIIDYNVKRSPGQFKCCPNMTFPSLKFNFLVKRHFAANVVFLLLPFMVLAAITVLAIWLNPRSPERIYITAVNIFCHTYYLLNSTWELPPYSDCVPKLILLIRNSQILATVVLIETVVIRQLLNKCSDSPKWLIDFFSVFTSNTIGQIFLYPELYSNNSNADDAENLVEDKSEINKWNLLGILLDRFIFFLFIIIYIIMFINCIPK